MILQNKIRRSLYVFLVFTTLFLVAPLISHADSTKGIGCQPRHSLSKQSSRDPTDPFPLLPKYENIRWIFGRWKYMHRNDIIADLSIKNTNQGPVVALRMFNKDPTGKWVQSNFENAVYDRGIIDYQYTSNTVNLGIQLSAYKLKNTPMLKPQLELWIGNCDLAGQLRSQFSDKLVPWAGKMTMTSSGLKPR